MQSSDKNPIRPRLLFLTGLPFDESRRRLGIMFLALKAGDAWITAAEVADLAAREEAGLTALPNVDVSELARGARAASRVLDTYAGAQYACDFDGHTWVARVTSVKIRGEGDAPVAIYRLAVIWEHRSPKMDAGTH